MRHTNVPLRSRTAALVTSSGGWLALFVVAGQASQLDSRVDPELCEHVAEVTVHSVGGHEEPFGDFSVGQAFGHEAGHSELGSGDRRPAGQFGFRGNDPPSNAKVPEPTSNAARVPGCPDLDVHRQRATEGVDPWVGVRRNEADPEVLQGRGVVEPSRAVLEQAHRYLELCRAALEETGNMCSGR